MSSEKNKGTNKKEPKTKFKEVPIKYSGSCEVRKRTRGPTGRSKPSKDFVRNISARQKLLSEDKGNHYDIEEPGNYDSITASVVSVPQSENRPSEAISTQSVEPLVPIEKCKTPPKIPNKVKLDMRKLQSTIDTNDEIAPPIIVGSNMMDKVTETSTMENNPSLPDKKSISKEDITTINDEVFNSKDVSKENSAESLLKEKHVDDSSNITTTELPITKVIKIPLVKKSLPIKTASITEYEDKIKTRQGNVLRRAKSVDPNPKNYELTEFCIINEPCVGSNKMDTSNISGSLSKIPDVLCTKDNSSLNFSEGSLILGPSPKEYYAQQDHDTQSKGSINVQKDSINNDDRQIEETDSTKKVDVMEHIPSIDKTIGVEINSDSNKEHNNRIGENIDTKEPTSVSTKDTVITDGDTNKDNIIGSKSSSCKKPKHSSTKDEGSIVIDKADSKMASSKKNSKICKKAMKSVTIKDDDIVEGTDEKMGNDKAKASTLKHDEKMRKASLKEEEKMRKALLKEEEKNKKRMQKEEEKQKKLALKEEEKKRKLLLNEERKRNTSISKEKKTLAKKKSSTKNDDVRRSSTSGVPSNSDQNQPDPMSDSTKNDDNANRTEEDVGSPVAITDTVNNEIVDNVFNKLSDKQQINDVDSKTNEPQNSTDQKL